MSKIVTIPFNVKEPKPKSFQTVITPEVAQALLLTMVDNRPLRNGVAEKYGAEMKAGHWRVTNEGIGLDRNGHLIDGQHRLYGCIDADVNFTTMVTVGLEEAAREVINTGLTRSIGDVIALRSGQRFSPIHVGTGRWMMSLRPAEVSRQDTLNFLERHEKAIAFAAGITAVKKISIAPMLAVIARAYYNHPETELERFVKVVATGIPLGDFCTPALVLRNWLLTKKAASRTEIYYKTETALSHFLDKRAIRGDRLYEAKGELFPLTKAR